MTSDPMVLSSDRESDLIRLENLGRYVTPESRPRFEEIVRTIAPSDIVDITHWTRDALYALLIFCEDTKRMISLKNGSRSFTPVIFPEGPLLDALVDAILNGEL